MKIDNHLIKRNMTLLTTAGCSPRIFFVRQILILWGILSCAILIVYISSSSNNPGIFSSARKDDGDRWNNGADVDKQSMLALLSSSNALQQDTFPEELQLSMQPQNQEQKIVSETKNPRSERDSDQVSSAVIIESEVLPPPPKKILLWNSYWNSRALWHKIFSEIVHKQCPQSNCVLTNDRSQVNSSDAVLFHLVDIFNDSYTFPEYRNPNQIWIGMSYEPPYILQYIGLDFTRLNGVFNRTMSYRTDSDIVVRHGTYHSIQRPITSSYVSNWVNSHESIQNRNYALGKRRLVAWFASSRNCKSQSGREEYVKELQNYIQVDIYGSCGPYKCGNQKTMRNPYKVEEDDCYMLVSVGYKFVLAFENSLCEDYVTEKLYNHLKLNVVPVVLGASNYSMFAPPHSVIEASQYSPEELSQYLQYLDKNDSAYNEYFQWKHDYAVEAHDGVPLACDLCEQLHNPNWQMERKVYEHFDKWILSGCRKGYAET